MYFYIIGCKAKVVHMQLCFHLRGKDKVRVGVFHTLEEARQQGYRLCNHCAPISRFLRGQNARLQQYCQQNGMLYRLVDGCITVQTPHSTWKIIVNGKTKRCIFLYHKNTFETGKAGFVPGYHSQAVRRDSILEYLEYINAHECYRRNNPVTPIKQTPPPPRKGTKRWYKEQKHQRYTQRKAAIKQTLALLGQISG